MNRAMFAALTLALLFTSQATSDDKKNNEPFQGKWKIASIVANGETIPTDQFENAVLTVTGDERVLKDGDEVKSKAKYKVDPTKTPKTIDIMVSEGTLKGKTIKGIYEITGDTMKICANLEGMNYPKEFKSETGSGILLQTFKRMADK